MPLINDANDFGVDVYVDVVGKDNINVEIGADGSKKDVNVKIEEPQGASVTADVLGRKNANVSLTADDTTLSAYTNLSGAEPQYFRDHVLNMNNPHQTTAEQVKAVPLELGGFARIDPTANTKGFRQQAFVYVNKGNQGFRMSLQEIKDLNTKIVDAKSHKSVNSADLSVGDYIYSED